MKKIVLKGLLRIAVTTTVIILFLMIFGRHSEGADLNRTYYEKNGCIYLIGNPTEEEKSVDIRLYKERMIERSKQINDEIYRNHDIEIEEIRAKALENYLIAQSIPLREVADAIRRIKIRQNTIIGDINTSSSIGDMSNTSYSISEGGLGGTATTGSTTNTNSATGGSGGTSTHNDY